MFLLILFLSFLFVRHIGNKPPQNIRAELVALLCVADRTHSQLVELMPERCGAGKSQDFDVILAEVGMTVNRFVGLISVRHTK